MPHAVPFFTPRQTIGSGMPSAPSREAAEAPPRGAANKSASIHGKEAMRRGSSFPARRRARRGAAGALAFALLLAWPSEARASLLSPELEDKLATIIAVLVLVLVPIVLIVLFWLVHILPEKIAHQRHHPQFEAIRTLCLLSLVFGGLLWPLAWIWAYSRPVFHKMAYGTDTVSHGDGDYPPDDADTASLQERLARIEGRVPSEQLAHLRADLDAIEARLQDEGGR
jgi:hypothetical protein